MEKKKPTEKKKIIRRELWWYMDVAHIKKAEKIRNTRKEESTAWRTI